MARATATVTPCVRMSSALASMSPCVFAISGVGLSMAVDEHDVQNGELPVIGLCHWGLSDVVGRCRWTTLSPQAKKCVTGRGRSPPYLKTSTFSLYNAISPAMGSSCRVGKS